VLWCPLQFRNKNYLWFVFTSSCLWDGSSPIYVICSCLRSVVCCCVFFLFFFVFFVLCLVYPRKVRFWLPLECSLTFINTRCKKHEFQHSHADTQTYTNKSKLNENAWCEILVQHNIYRTHRTCRDVIRRWPELGLSLIYVICSCLRSVVCGVLLFFLFFCFGFLRFLSCDMRIVRFWLPLECSLTFINTRYKKHEFQHSHADTQTYTNKSKLNENVWCEILVQHNIYRTHWTCREDVIRRWPELRDINEIQLWR
jgi:uncharacterized protein YjaG (DUF416 family)